METQKFRSVYVGVSAALILLSIAVRVSLPITVASGLFAIGVVIFSKKQWHKWTAVVGCVGFNILTSTGAGFPVRCSMPVEGYIRDQVTNKPIENAIFETEWFERRATIVETVVGHTVDTTYGVSDKNGRYLLKGRFTLDFLHPNISRMVRLRHPLYETIDFMPKDSGMTVLDRECWAKEKESKVFRVNTCDIKIKSVNRVIPYDIKLVKLEDKYRENKKPDSACAILDAINEFSPYIRTVIAAGICKTIDLRTVPDMLHKLLVVQPEHYCKAMGLKTIGKWREEIEKREIFNSIGAYWIKLYESPEFRQQKKQAEVLRYELSKGCYD